METRRKASLARPLLWGIAAVVGVASLGLSSCVPETGPNQLDSDYKPIRISVSSLSDEQQILGGLYEQALNRESKHAFLSLEHYSVNDDRLTRLQQKSADLIVGCTGELLYRLNPVEARKLSDEWLAATRGDHGNPEEKNSGEWRDTVYKAMVGSLPGSLLAGDPSNATGCADYDGPPLPQNIVPVYRKPMLDRDDRLDLNRVAGTISTDDMNKMLSEVKAGQLPSVVATTYGDRNDI